MSRTPHRPARRAARPIALVSAVAVAIAGALLGPAGAAHAERPVPQPAPVPVAAPDPAPAPAPASAPASTHQATPAEPADAPAERSEFDTVTTLSVDASAGVHGGLTVLGVTVALSGPVELTGHPVTIFANGAPVATVSLFLSGGGTYSAFALLTGDLPAGELVLTATFAGGTGAITGDNYARASASAPVPLTLAPAATAVSIEGTAGPVRADEPAEYRVTVRNTAEASFVPPRGVVEILVDGTVVQAQSIDAAATPTERAATVTATLTGLAAGFHRVSARLVPTGDFAASASDELPLDVIGIATALTPAAAEVHGGPDRPATVDVSVARAPGAAGLRSADAPLEGTVQAFRGTEPVGAPVPLAGGAATVPLAGLAPGSHAIELRYVPADPAFLPSSAEITAIVAAPAPAPGPDPDPAPRPAPAADPATVTPAPAPAALARTGAADPTGPLAGSAAAALLVAGAATLAAARLRRRG